MNIYKQELTQETKQKTVGVHRIFIIDCSGSMWQDLPLIREHLKKKIITTIKEEDSLSILWFSSKNQAGIVIKNKTLKNLADYQEAEDVIDRWLKPISLTGFVEPIYIAKELIQEDNSNRATSVVFMSDGWDNQWTKAQILEATKNLKDYTFTTIQYGYGSDKKMLEDMAQAAGGKSIFSENYLSYNEFLEQELDNENVSGKIDVRLEQPNVYDFAWAYDNGILMFDSEDGYAKNVPKSAKSIFYCTNSSYVAERKDNVLACAVLAKKAKNDDVFSLLGKINDRYLTFIFENCFSKQDLLKFEEACELVYSGEVEFSGADDDKVYCNYPLVDFLSDLSEDEVCKILLTKEFLADYNKISASNYESELKFKKDIEEAKKGYPINLTFSMSRPNISVQVRQNGTIDLPENDFGLSAIKTFRYRNYSIVRDGIKNVKKLYLRLSKDIHMKLALKGATVNPYYNDKFVYVVDIENMPLLDRAKINNLNSVEYFYNHVELLNEKAMYKVHNYYRNILAPKRSEGFDIVYGEECSNWLKELGITDYNGYSPPYVSFSSKDYYIGKEVKVLVKSCSSLPSVKQVLNKKGNYTVSQKLIADAISSYVQESSFAEQKGLEKEWIVKECNAINKRKRSVVNEIAKTNFALMVAKKWFADMDGYEDNSRTVTVNGDEFTCSIELVDKKINL